MLFHYAFVLLPRMISNEIIQFFRKLIRDSVEYRSKENISRDDFLQYVAKQVMVNGKIGKMTRRLSSYLKCVDSAQTVRRNASGLSNFKSWTSS